MGASSHGPPSGQVGPIARTSVLAPVTVSTSNTRGPRPCVLRSSMRLARRSPSTTTSRPRRPHAGEVAVRVVALRDLPQRPAPDRRRDAADDPARARPRGRRRRRGRRPRRHPAGRRRPRRAHARARRAATATGAFGASTASAPTAWPWPRRCTPTAAPGSAGAARRVYRGLGVAAFAETVITQETGAVKIPDDVPLDVACVIGCAVQTGVGAVLHTADVQSGDTVLVLGLGGVGQSVVQGARLAGATTIIVSDPVAERREAALRFGATHALDPDHRERGRPQPGDHRRRRRLRLRRGRQGRRSCRTAWPPPAWAARR